MPQPLQYHDLSWCLRRAPRALLQAMKETGASVFVAGGYIRSCISNETVNDIDCFTSSKDAAKAFALKISPDGEKAVHETDNAFTVRMRRGPVVQVIHRWVFDTPQNCVESFDFTIARAAFWFSQDFAIVGEDGKMNVDGRWESVVDDRFYPDLAGKRLIYCQPIRNEDAGGSLLRVLKFYQRGYRIPVDSLGAVIARFVMGMRIEELAHESDRMKGQWSPWSEEKIARVGTGLLREVDPNVDPTHVAHLPAEQAAAEARLAPDAPEAPDIPL